MKIDIINALPIEAITHASAWYEGADWLQVYHNDERYALDIGEDRKAHVWVDSSKVVEVKDGKAHFVYYIHNKEEMGTEICPAIDYKEDFWMDLSDERILNLIKLKEDEYVFNAA